MITLSTCPICSGNNFVDFLICKDHTTSCENFSLKKCGTCEFTFTDPKPDEQSIGKYYQSDKYISHTGGQKKLLDSIYLLARKIALTNKRRLVEEKFNGKSVLDFGCGTGEFLKEMKDHGWRIAGVEPSQKANEKAFLTTNNKIYKSLSEIQESNFDVITLWHVLEHLHDLNGSLRKFFDLLKESGTIFIAVPNMQSYDAQFYKSFWAGYDVPRHLWHFNQENMKKLLENNGFILSGVIPMKMDSYYVSLLSESYKHPDQPKFINLIKAFNRGLVSNLKAKKSSNYSSLIYIARR
ncbi:MAG: class I SAM-dependent methyltransferase [Bacteroidetes bacterium]|nr:class I SAM-dependent methyltransferase [Bacteroidota bacterium]MBI3482987.1 class I SAM-dependent methyltransferase [Bacteroidota bacterium]